MKALWLYPLFEKAFQRRNMCNVIACCTFFNTICLSTILLQLLLVMLHVHSWVVCVVGKMLQWDISAGCLCTTLELHSVSFLHLIEILFYKWISDHVNDEKKHEAMVLLRLQLQITVQKRIQLWKVLLYRKEFSYA